MAKRLVDEVRRRRVRRGRLRVGSHPRDRRVAAEPCRHRARVGTSCHRDPSIPLVAQFLLLPGCRSTSMNRPRPRARAGRPRTSASGSRTYASGARMERCSRPAGRARERCRDVLLRIGVDATRGARPRSLVARHGHGAPPRLAWTRPQRRAEHGVRLGCGSRCQGRRLLRPEPGGCHARVGVLGLSLGGEVGLAATAPISIEGGRRRRVSARSWADARLEPDPHPVGYVNRWLTFAPGRLAPEPRPSRRSSGDPMGAPVLMTPVLHRTSRSWILCTPTLPQMRRSGRSRPHRTQALRSIPSSTNGDGRVRRILLGDRLEPGTDEGPRSRLTGPDRAGCWTRQARG